MDFRKILMTGACVVSLMGLGTVPASADTATLNLEAVIVTPLDIACATNLDFGSIDAGLAGGTITLDTTGTPTYGGSTVGIGAFPPTAGQCTTTGDTTLAYTVTIPNSSVDDAGAGTPMNVENFTIDDGVNGESSATAGYSTALVAGAGTLDIGADLVVGAAQTPGTYTGTVVVTAIYD